jgi:hypothetical protein
MARLRQTGGQARRTRCQLARHRAPAARRTTLTAALFGQRFGAVDTEDARARPPPGGVAGTAAEAAQPRQRWRRLGQKKVAERFDSGDAHHQAVQQDGVVVLR